MNWVEKRFTRERNAINGSTVLWQEVLTAVDDACNSFSRNCESPEIHKRTENGHAVVVRAEFPSHFGIPRVNTVRIELDKQERIISSTQNDKSPKKFRIDADEEGCFILSAGDKITPDKLSELVLSDAFFKAPEPPRQTPPSSSGSQGWMGN